MLRVFSRLKEVMQVENPGFYLYMFKLISMPNRMTMKRLVHNGYISSNQLLLEILELFHLLYETPIECSIFRHVLNTYLARHLQLVIRKYRGLTPSISNSSSWVLVRPNDYLYKMPVKVENNSVLPEKSVYSVNNSTVGLNSNLHVFVKRVLDHLEDFSLRRKTSVIVNANDCDASFLPKKKVCDNVGNFQSFLLPLQQDYTKSSKGYTSKNECDKTEPENAVILFSNNNFQNNEEPVDNNDFNTSDDDDNECYDPAQNLIISRYLNSLNSSSSESKVSYSKICYDSDSDDSVVFSDNIGENTQERVFPNQYGAGKKIELNVSFSDSDSDDSVVFSDNIVENTQERVFPNQYGAGKKIELNVSFSDSDSDDSVVFSDNIVENTQERVFPNQYGASKKTELNASFSSDSDSDDSVVFSDNIVENTQERVFPNQYGAGKKTELNVSLSSDSDSDDSVVFSDNIVENTQERVFPNQYGAGKKTELNVSFNCDSDSDDSIESVEMYDSKYPGKSSKRYKYTYENDHDSETYSSDLFERSGNNISFSLHQKFDSSCDFSDSSFSLSQSKMTFYSTDFKGFSNPCFEDDNVSSLVNLKDINDKWENSMQAISCEPREPKRVSFVPLPDLVSVQIFEPDDDNYRYSIFVLDQIRFRNRIQEFEEVIKPYLSPAHRAKVYQCYNSRND